MKKSIFSLPLLAACAIGHAQCVLSAAPISLGVYYPQNTQSLKSSASVQVNCAPQQEITMSLLYGNPAQRSMSNARDVELQFTVFLDPARTVYWGDGTQGGSKYKGLSGSIPLFFTIPARQVVPAGSYSATMGVLLEF